MVFYTAMLSDLISLAEFLGLRPENLFPLVLILGSGFLLIWHFYLKDVSRKLTTLTSNMEVLRNAACELQKFLDKKFEEFMPLHKIKTKGFAEEHSPLSPTDTGQDLLEKSGAKKAIDVIFPAVERIIEIRSPKTAYDLQEIAKDVVLDFRDANFMTAIKEFVYHHPRFHNKPVELLDIQGLMVLYIRDKYLKKHPELLKK